MSVCSAPDDGSEASAAVTGKEVITQANKKAVVFITAPGKEVVNFEIREEVRFH